jgi:hypothetical protein
LVGLTGRVSVTLALALTACAQDKKVGSAESSSPQPPTAAIVAADEIPEVSEEPTDPEEVAPEEAAPEEAEAAKAAEVAAAEDGATPTPAANAEAAEPDEEAADTPAAAEGKSKVLILGDSLAATGFGALLERRLDAHPDVVAYRKARSSSGLARPDFYDWMGEAKRQVDARTPDVVVVIIGGNDGQDLTNKSGKGKRVHWKSDEWSGAYRERVAKFVDELRGDGRKVLWLGLPRTGTVSFEKKLDLIREVQINAMADYEDVEYFDTSPFFVDDKGDLRRTADVGRKKNQTLRADDGIHFTMAGAQYFADQVYPEVLRSLGVEDAAE